MPAQPKYNYYRYISYSAGISFLLILLLQYILSPSPFLKFLLAIEPILIVIYFYCSNAYIKKLIRSKDAKINALRWKLRSKQ